MEGFWKEKNVFNKLLLPIATLYNLGYRIRRKMNICPYNSKIQVVCIGNVVMGGAGKTPLAIALGKELLERGIKFCYLSKGYKGNFKGVMRVNRDIHSARDVGDEPLLLAEQGDVYVSKNRVKGLKYINKYFADYDLIIMDDGFQNPTFVKHKKILVVDGNYGFGNSLLFPAGPLREDFVAAINNSDLVVINGEDRANIKARCEICNKKCIKVYTESSYTVEDMKEWKSREYVAFAAIGRPEKFFKTLNDVGFKIRESLSFPDHHFFSCSELQKIYDKSLHIITTKKDWVRLGLDDRLKIEYLPIELKMDTKSLKILLNVVLN